MKQFIYERYFCSLSSCRCDGMVAGSQTIDRTDGSTNAIITILLSLVTLGNNGSLC